MNKEERNKKDRDRMNKGGRFASEAYADEHPDETTSEIVGSDPLRKIFKRLHNEKGAILCERATERGVEFGAFGYTCFYEPGANESGEDTAGYDG